MAKGIFLTGTGTDIGKTYIAGLLVKTLAEAGKRPAYYKAAMSGNDRRPDGSLIPGDGAFVKTFSGIGQSLESMCPYVYEHAWSPHLAARFEGPQIDLEVVKAGWRSVCERYDYVTMEGSGGIPQGRGGHVRHFTAHPAGGCGEVPGSGQHFGGRGGAGDHQQCGPYRRVYEGQGPAPQRHHL